MKILFYDMISYTYKDIRDAFEALGHNVKAVHYHFSNRFEDEFFVQRFSEIIRSDSWDLIFSINFFPVVAQLAHEFSIPYVSWSYDSPLSADLEPYFAYDTNRIFLFDRSEVEFYTKKRYSNVFHLPLAANPASAAASIAGSRNVQKYDCDVSFVGSLYNASLEPLLAPWDEYMKGYISGLLAAQLEVYGFDILSHSLTDDFLSSVNNRYREVLGEGATILSAKGLSYAIEKQITFSERVTLLDTFGGLCDTRFYSTAAYPFESGVKFCGPVKYHSEMPLVFNRSRLNLCPTLRSIHSGIPLRSLDILSCGGVLLSNYQPELAEYFEDGVDVIMYSSLEEAIEKGLWYLQNEDVRTSIAGHAHDKLVHMFNYKDRATILLSAI